MANPPTTTVDKLFSTLHERAKELSCLYTIEEILSHYDLTLEEIFRRIIDSIPPGWQYPDACQARLTYGSELYESPDFVETTYVHCADIRIQETTVGQLCVSYKELKPPSDVGPFMAGEVKLIHTVADRLGHFVLHQRLRQVYEEMSEGRREHAEEKGGWRIALNLLRNTDQNLFIRVSRKMMNYLGWRGVTEVRPVLERYGKDAEAEGVFGESNWPQQRESLDRFCQLSEETFRIASANLTDEEILARIQRWISEDRSSTAVKDLENIYASMSDVLDSVQRLQHLTPDGLQLPRATADSIRVALIRRIFTEQLEYINIAKKYVALEDFFGLLERIVFPTGSRGKLGGKSAGLFLANLILRQAVRRIKAIGEIKTPRTWYIASDGMRAFLQFNNLEDVIEQKYKDLDEIRREYPHLIQVFKNSYFPPEIVKGLSLALDDLGEVPLIVRSSSLLEDRLGSAFAGKYKSLFLANQGDKKKRLAALLDAVSEVYASTFSPDPIQYRSERGLLDFYEEMGIMIQEVVGKRVGKYYFPAFAGVAFSRNEFCWSPRIRREDGLLRLVPGLGTRAVDRVSDDYPILVAPSQPNLRVNVSEDEVVRYSPKKIDLIDFEKDSFETTGVRDLLREVANEYPGMTKVCSVYRDGLLQRPLALATDFGSDDLVVTFDGLISGSPFIRQLEAILKTLESALGTPVDVEFAHDGTDFFLLQCRAQSYALDEAAVEIPARVPEDAVLFTANRYICNGRVPAITHIVYVDPDQYGRLGELPDLVAVGQAVGKLNKLLPRRQFILLGPGRWGSRGDIKLGVRVTYADISNASMLIEVARKKGNYVPDVSFGTHFFQDLAESGIRYLPLYPDDPGIVFNETFFLSSPNLLPELLPEYAALAKVLKVIDVAAATRGRVLQVLLNAEREQAVAMFTDPGAVIRAADEAPARAYLAPDDHSKWRVHMAEQIAWQMEAARWGIKGVYLAGSANSGAAGPGSDIDLLVHFHGTARQRKEMELWLQGWSLSLAEMNRLRTGLSSSGLLDVKFLTDDDVAAGRGEAAKIKTAEDPARELPLQKARH